MLQCELARERVEAAHALDRDEDGFVRRKTRVREGGQLVAEVAFQFGHVGAVDGLPAAPVHPPSRELLFERLLERRAVHESRQAVTAFPPWPSASVASTSCIYIGALCLSAD